MPNRTQIKRRKELVTNLEEHLGHTVTVRDSGNIHFGEVVRVSTDDPESSNWIGPKIWIDEGDKFLNSYYYDQVSACSCQKMEY